MSIQAWLSVGFTPVLLSCFVVTGSNANAMQVRGAVELPPFSDAEINRVRAALPDSHDHAHSNHDHAQNNHGQTQNNHGQAQNNRGQVHNNRMPAHDNHGQAQNNRMPAHDNHDHSRNNIEHARNTHDRAADHGQAHSVPNRSGRPNAGGFVVLDWRLETVSGDDAQECLLSLFPNEGLHSWTMGPLLFVRLPTERADAVSDCIERLQAAAAKVHAQNPQPRETMHAHSLRYMSSTSAVQTLERIGIVRDGLRAADMANVNLVLLHGQPHQIEQAVRLLEEIDRAPAPKQHKSSSAAEPKPSAAEREQAERMREEHQRQAERRDLESRKRRIAEQEELADQRRNREMIEHREKLEAVMQKNMQKLRELRNQFGDGHPTVKQLEKATDALGKHLKRDQP